MRYWIESEDLWSANEAGVVWRGRPDGHPPVSVGLLPGSDHAIVLLDVESGPRKVIRWLVLALVACGGLVSEGGRGRGCPNGAVRKESGSVVRRNCEALGRRDRREHLAGVEVRRE